jgi:hypothetical protein
MEQRSVFLTGQQVAAPGLSGCVVCQQVHHDEDMASEVLCSRCAARNCARADVWQQYQRELQAWRVRQQQIGKLLAVGTLVNIYNPRPELPAEFRRTSTLHLLDRAYIV